MIVNKLNELMTGREMGLIELSDKSGISINDLTLLKNGRAKAIRFSSLSSICAALKCQPGDLFEYQNGSDENQESHADTQDIFDFI